MDVRTRMNRLRWLDLLIDHYKHELSDLAKDKELFQESEKSNAIYKRYVSMLDDELKKLEQEKETTLSLICTLEEKRQQLILIMKYYKGMTIKEVAYQMGISSRRVSALASIALKELSK